MNENHTQENPAEEKLNPEDELTNNAGSENDLPESVNPISESTGSNNTEIAEKTNPVEETSDSNETDTNVAGEDSRSRFQEFFNEAIEENHPKMTAILLTFYELRSIDEELTDIEDEKGDLPEKIKAIKSEINSIEKELKIKNHSLSLLEEEKTGLTTNNNSFEERINKYDEQKYDVRSNKEYDEIVKTIESLFEEVKKNEIRLKEIDAMNSKLSAEAEALESKTKILSEELTENQTLLDELDEQYKTDESALKEKRNLLLEKIDSAGRSLYERINRSYKGEATAIVRKGNCSGCYNSIPPQRVIEIKSAEKIFTCQSCGRILIAEEIISSSIQ